MSIRIDITYEGGLRCCAVHGPSHDRLRTDAPADNQGRGEAFSPTDLVATALGTCMATIMAIVGERHGIDLTGMRVCVEKHMVADPMRRIDQLTAVVSVPRPLTRDQQLLLERAAADCPVNKSLDPRISRPVRFEWRP